VRIYLYWHTETEDINLGEGFVDVLPPVGSLIVYVPEQMPKPRPAHWRVTTVQISPAMVGSQAIRNRRGDQLGIYHVFVEPAEGPFHP
jgi:hypothetical protein